tara:strand:+ start:422 stop:1303 length:882 start_codon:yes stop_codon:yes gene_type:complete
VLKNKSTYWLLSVLLVAGCMTSRQPVVDPPAAKILRDGPPADDVDVSTIPDAVPRVDPVTIAGNKNPYTVLGKTYHLLPTSKGHREVGLASWYGSKFHGQKTSNGETYSMYGMTAAHKTLPIPCYARVTNLATNRSVIVRINDRGPFYDNRVIDLSYVAAKKLGYSEHGTTTVEVTVIDPVAFQKNSVQSPSVPGVAEPSPAPFPRVTQGAAVSKSVFLQVGAYSSQAAASQFSEQLSGLTIHPVAVRESVNHKERRSVFRVLVGPISDHLQLEQAREQLQQQGSVDAFVVHL